MDEQEELELSGLMADDFDNLSVNLDRPETLQDLFQQVVDVAFVAISENLS